MHKPEGSMSPAPDPAVKLSPVSINEGFEQQQPQLAPPPIFAPPVSSIPMDEGFPLQKKVKGRFRGSFNMKKEKESSVGKKVISDAWALDTAQKPYAWQRLNPEGDKPFARMFLRLLIEQLPLPTYCLVDCDPYGFDILTTYRFDSMILRFPEIKWLEVFPSDADRYNFSQQSLLLMTAEDNIKTVEIVNRCYLQRLVLEWRLELELLLRSGVKFEIEALSVYSLNWLSKEYLPSKIQDLWVIID